MVIWYKIFAWFGNLNPYLLGLLFYFILVPVALALRGPLALLTGRWAIASDWVSSIINPGEYNQEWRRYTPLPPRSFWLITLCLWGVGILVAVTCWWVDLRY